MKNENELIHESSPYLQQHAQNPVHWKAWNSKTLEFAQQVNKPLLISIGYAACHWCHVMEHETFEDKEAAALMNANFICIKVDREERPDVDQIYMSAAQLINGNGGWPLNALAFPDGKPFFAATYFPKKRWMEMLQYFIQQFHNNHDELKAQSEHLSNGIRDYHVAFNSKDAPDFSEEDLEIATENLLRNLDMHNGGYSGNIKFPMPSIWELMAETYFRTSDQRLLDALKLVLDNMMNGGIYDQLGGGFSRYSTDSQWIVPHFEKMLYDNAQLISLYSHAYQLTGLEKYKIVAVETIDFAERELNSGNGYFSSVDADSNGSEGEFYVWSYNEITNLLKQDASKFIAAFGATPGGNFENGKNVLFRNEPVSWEDKEIDTLRKILFDAREKRSRPAIDNKILTSWNALMSTALTDAGCAFDNKNYLDKSKKLLDFILSSMITYPNELYRNYQQGKAMTRAFLDDYAFLIKALIDYYEATFEIEYLNRAKQLNEYVLSHFFNEESKLFFYNNNDFQEVFSRPAEFSDDVIPSSNAVMAENLFRLGMLYHEDLWIGKAATMVKNLKTAIEANPRFYSYWLRLMQRLVHPPFEIAIIGKDAPQLLSSFYSHYLPDCIFCGSRGEENIPLLQNKPVAGKTLIYVCVARSCRQPVESVPEALALLNGHKK